MLLLSWCSIKVSNIWLTGCRKPNTTFDNQNFPSFRFHRWPFCAFICIVKEEIDQARHNKQAYAVVKISNRKILKADINPSRALMCGASFFSRSQRKPNDVGLLNRSLLMAAATWRKTMLRKGCMQTEWRQAVKWNIKTLFPTSDCSKRSCAFHLALCKGLRRWRELASYPFILFLECFLRRRLRDATKRWFVGSHSK